MARHYLDNIGLSVWITNSKGERLEEFPVPGQAVRTGNRETIELIINFVSINDNGAKRVQNRCWIPAVAGEGFTIHWKTDYEQPDPSNDRDLDYGGSGTNSSGRQSPIPKNKLRDLRCKIALDGDEREPGVLDAYSIYHELQDSGAKDGEVDEYGYFRPYKFGKLPLTDDDSAFLSNDLYKNRIEVELEWGTIEELGFWDPLSRSTSPISSTDMEPIHEQKLKSGNHSTAGLGEPVATPVVPCKTDREKMFSFTKENGAASQRFVFHHAENAWLVAQKIIPGDVCMEPVPQPPKPRVGSRTRAQTLAELSLQPPQPLPNQGQVEPEDTKRSLKQEATETEEIDPKSEDFSNHGPHTDLTSGSNNELAAPNNDLIAPPSDITSPRPLKRASSQEIIDVDALSDSEVGSQMDHKANVADSRAWASRIRTFRGKITQRKPRRGSGPNKRAKMEVEEDVKLEETSVVVGSEPGGNSEADIRSNFNAPYNSDDDVVVLSN